MALALLIAGHGDGTPMAMGSAMAQDNAPRPPFRQISTAGTAKVLVQPDSARVFFRVTLGGAEVKSLRASNARKVNDVMESLAAQKIPDLYTKTSAMDLSVVWEEKDRTRIKGYTITNAFTVRVVNNDPAKLGELAAKIMDVALEAGANGVDQVRFFKADDSADRREALKKAVVAARANADAMAGAADVQIAGPITISGQPQYFFRGDMYNNTQVQSMGPRGGGDDSGSSLTPGDIELECTVNATYEFR
jgi:uncharacterized protein YggE